MRSVRAKVQAQPASAVGPDQRIPGPIRAFTTMVNIITVTDPVPPR